MSATGRWAVIVRSGTAPRWLVATAALTNQLLAVGTERPLSIVAEQALAAAEAHLATLVLPTVTQRSSSRFGLPPRRLVQI